MTIDGYIIVNKKTLEVLRYEETGCEFDYVFENVDVLCEYVKTKNLILGDYIVHHVNGEVYELDVDVSTYGDY